MQLAIRWHAILAASSGVSTMMILMEVVALWTGRELGVEAKPKRTRICIEFSGYRPLDGTCDVNVALEVVPRFPWRG